jgi:hypothetical protein
MTQSKLELLTVAQLVERFIEIGVAQDNALLENAISRFNRLFDQKTSVLQELKSRAGDQRRALMKLYNHENLQVRLNAVKATLALEPTQARAALQAIADSKRYPQAGDAGMSLWNLDQGIYKPT